MAATQMMGFFRSLATISASNGAYGTAFDIEPCGGAPHGTMANSSAETHAEAMAAGHTRLFGNPANRR